MKCPFRFGLENENCIEDECESYGKTLLMARTDKKFLWIFPRNEFMPFPYCFALKTRINLKVATKEDEQ